MNPLHDALATASRERAMRQVWQAIALLLAVAVCGIGISAGAAQDRVRTGATP